MLGQIVSSKSGRDKGCFLAIVKEENGVVFVCDGKKRPLDRPKSKNVKHLQFTNTVLTADCFKSDRSLRKALAIYRDKNSREETLNG